MTAATLTLADFLLARIAEDETLARSARDAAQTPWRATYGRQVETSRDGYLVTPEDEHSYSTDPPENVALHIARHDPARVLAECEAKRRIVEMHGAYEYTGVVDCDTCGCADCDPSAARWPCPTIRALAAVYADHPEFRGEWRV